MPYHPKRRLKLSGNARKRNMRTAEKHRKLLRLSLLIVFCLMVGYGMGLLIPYAADLIASRQVSREMQRIQSQALPDQDSSKQAFAEAVSPTFAPLSVTDTPQPTALPGGSDHTGSLQPVKYPNNPTLKISDRFKNLRKKGEYIVGWIRFDELDEPVAQKDNSYFLNRDATGKRNSNGAIFLDSAISLRTRPYTIILYGHNMKSGNMFGRLKKYEESAYFYKHRIITFDTMYEDGQYVVFAVMEISTTPGVARWFDLWSLTTDIYENREEAIRTLERQSVISSALDVQADDQILLLVTCLDGDPERLVVAARRLREGEQANQLHIKKQSDGNY